MLNGRIALHEPNCNTYTCDPTRCLLDVESVCREVLNDHLAIGSRRGDGSYTGPSFLSDSDYEDALQHLVITAWQLSARWDGRGRLAGYVVGLLHKRVVDWKRSRWHSTRHGHTIVELTDEERVHVAALVDLTGPEVLELVNSAELSQPHRLTLERVVIPIVFSGSSVEEYAQRSGKPVSQVNREIRSLGRAIERTNLLAA